MLLITDNHQKQNSNHKGCISSNLIDHSNKNILSHNSNRNILLKVENQYDLK